MSGLTNLTEIRFITSEVKNNRSICIGRQVSLVKDVQLKHFDYSYFIM